MARRPKIYLVRKNYGDFQPERGVNPTSAYGCGGTCGRFFGGGWGRCNKGCKCRGGLCVPRNRREGISQLERNFSGGYLNSSGANVMLCHGQYVVNDPCYPMCSRQDGNGCEQPWGGPHSGGPTQGYSITQGDGRGDSFTRHVSTPIDPYQSITPEDLGGSSSFRGYNSSGPGGTGDTIIKVGGDTYSYDPVLSYDMGCNIMDEMGDGIEPYKNCDNRGNSGIPGMNVSSLRYKNGVLV